MMRHLIGARRVMVFHHILAILHVVAAILWVGGSLTFLAMSLMAGRNEARLLGQVREMAALGPVFFLPASLMVVVTGLALILFGYWPWQAWNVLSLAAFGVSFAIGAAVVKPSMERADAAQSSGDPGAALSIVRNILRIGRFAQVMLLAIVALMVAKPLWTDVATLTVILVPVAIALIPLLVPRPAAHPA